MQHFFYMDEKDPTRVKAWYGSVGPAGLRAAFAPRRHERDPLGRVADDGRPGVERRHRGPQVRRFRPASSSQANRRSDDQSSRSARTVTACGLAGASPPSGGSRSRFVGKA